MKKIFKYQIYHFAAYLLLGFVLLHLTNNFMNKQETIFGLTVVYWTKLSWIFAGIFQLWIVLFWRLELYFKKISSIFGRHAFTIFRTGFIILMLSALLPVIPVSILTSESIDIAIEVKILLLIVSSLLILWVFYSVIFYFGINRVFGADHFFPEYRNKSLEKRGSFKYIPNSMYTIVLLLLYQPAIFFGSFYGLFFALIHHSFVWSHYFCTEKPDMQYIYKRK